MGSLPIIHGKEMIGVVVETGIEDEIGIVGVTGIEIVDADVQISVGIAILDAVVAGANYPLFFNR
ncbi:hypothetical protein ABE237_27260 [Brevibacillus formosus]|uniref:hypothetical protein n=1 Tax=Brevibacillus TaxID=55080 RepID=UPI0018CDEA4B|nr:MULTISPECIES: hypothetical protein [Brevibacillus]MBG9945630.1 hypothetical protein [Brevibacillus formosus]MED1947881.1 hypothetical protein [Brevibacillus formosus]MED2001492.1 hypothetical protein [Brevibacillus formosus]MED2085062.1 hypothetical protein [Brevibacillus formosus]